MKYLLLILLLFLAGCDSRVNKWDLDHYYSECREPGGVSQIDNFMSGATCVDGMFVKAKGRAK